MWLLRNFTGSAIFLFKDIEDLSNYILIHKDHSFGGLEFIQVYTKPDKGQSKKEERLLEPLSR